jgi:PilZ domain-containing protein
LLLSNDVDLREPLVFCSARSMKDYELRTRRLRKYAPKRRFTRYGTDFPLGVTVLRNDRYLRIQGRCCELAEAGLSVIIPEQLLTLIVGEMVILDLSLPSLCRHLTIRAIVRNRIGQRHGVEFVGSIPAHRESILTFCRGLRGQE